ncbi:DUF1330 domain-containing protein [Pseudonocardia yuanmonensis]
MSYYMLAALQKHDAEVFAQYQQRTAATLGAYECRPLSVNTGHKVIEGEGDPDVVVLLEFADEAEFDRWWNSPEYTEVKHLREKSATVLLGVAFGSGVHLPE